MLNQIIETKKEEVKHLVLPEMQDVPKHSFYEALAASKRTVALIAEVKKASPSKGIIQPNFDPLQVALQYDQAGADAISVLTDQQYFQGSSDYLTLIKRNIRRPVLRKDFIIDSLQIEESARMGADAILLIGEVLEPAQLQEFYEEAQEKGMDCLVEVHSAETLEGILRLFQPNIIGVNNRDLRTFHTTIQQTIDISSIIPNGSLLVSESGINHYKDIVRVKEAGAAAILVGESLMRKENQTEAVIELFGERTHANP
ncbi:indole-3-glycerol phosphate synthase TrpC [Priestia abyssalis]|uniref:indole-3-glycerol phosphate synthase TrpC n=1 Tax=Priestia abyssalis TaxID=1221450 RepID=UPI0009950FE2|nr:indole-3-glycerol phosphate synthase TrpC [Priestia abyssalis]